MCILCQSKFLILVKSPGICLEVLRSWNKAGQSPGKIRKMSWKVLESPGIWIMFFSGNPAVQIYNSYICGVDKADKLLASYRTNYRSRKWHHRFAFHMISQCAVNAWIMSCFIVCQQKQLFLGFSWCWS